MTSQVRLSEMVNQAFLLKCAGAKGDFSGGNPDSKKISRTLCKKANKRCRKPGFE